MPPDLRKAYEAVDWAIHCTYPPAPNFRRCPDRLAVLFTRYQQLTAD